MFPYIVTNINKISQGSASEKGVGSEVKHLLRMKKIIVCFLGSLTIISCQQEDRSYNQLIAEARNLYEAGKFEESGEVYSLAFGSEEGKDSIDHHYEAARSWALAEKEDLAFVQLEEISGNGEYADLAEISTDNDFSSLRTDKRWMTVLNKVSENRKEALAKIASVAATLEKVYQEDQRYRQQLGQIEEQYGRDSEEMQEHWELISRTDSINLVTVKAVLDKHGWLGFDLIGRNANNALFLVIQHADLESQKTYLPMLREAVKKGDAAAPDLALLEDRVALRQGEKQIYGSQIGRDPETGEYYVSPLLDPEDVDQRRAEVGLGPIQEYISNWGLSWDVEAYKQQLPELEAKQAK